jgi:streptogramin lyase
MSFAAPAVVEVVPPDQIIPGPMAVDSDGNLLIASRGGGGMLNEIAPDGSVRAWFPPPDAWCEQNGLTLGPDGSAYVSCYSEVLAYSAPPTRTPSRVLLPWYEGGPIFDARATAAESSGDLWIGDESGLMHHEAASGVTTALTEEPSYGVALAPWGGAVFSEAYRDRVGYVAAAGSGVLELMGPAGAGPGARLSSPRQVAVGPDGVVYVLGAGTHNVLALSPTGAVSELLGPRGGGCGFPALGHNAVASDGAGGFLVAAAASDAVFRVAPSATPEVVLEGTGDGVHDLDFPSAVAAANDGAVWVAGRASRNVFRIDAAGGVQQVLDASGAAGVELWPPTALAVDSAGTVYVGDDRGSVFAVSPAGSLSIVEDGSAWPPQLRSVSQLTFDADGRLLAAGRAVLDRLEPDGSWTRLLDANGDGTHALRGDVRVAIDGAGNAFALGQLAARLPHHTRWNGERGARSKLCRVPAARSRGASRRLCRRPRSTPDLAHRPRRRDELPTARRTALGRGAARRRRRRRVRGRRHPALRHSPRRRVGWDECAPRPRGHGVGSTPVGPERPRRRRKRHRVRRCA